MALPSDWIEKESSKAGGKKYFFNTKTGESRWDPPSEGAEVVIWHILVKHSASRNPSSWRSPEISCSLEEAKAKARSIRRELEGFSLSKFKEIATRESDCSSAKRGGSLGSVKRGQMQRKSPLLTFSLF